MLYFRNRSIACLTSGIFVPLRPHLECAIQANCPYLKNDIHLLESIQMATTRCLTYEERLQALKPQPQKEWSLRNDLVLTHKILYSHVELDATQLFKFPGRQGIRRSSIRLLHQTGRTRRRQNSFACRVVNNWNSLPLSVTLVTEQRMFQELLDTCLLIAFSLYSIFTPIWSFWALSPFLISK